MKTCERIVHAVNSRGDCNQDFKNQINIFYGELKEFFNAEGLDKVLDKIKGSAGNQTISG
jgi:hypothetical protein